MLYSLIREDVMRALFPLKLRLLITPIKRPIRLRMRPSPQPAPENAIGRSDLRRREDRLLDEQDECDEARCEDGADEGEEEDEEVHEDR